VRLVSKHFSAISTSLSQVDRDGKGGRARRDVDRRSTGEVVTSVDERPAIGVPCPTRNGVINESRPCKDEEQKGPKMPAFGETTNCDHWSAAWTLALLVYEHSGILEDTYVIAANMS
jgi:hypothetical protein